MVKYYNQVNSDGNLGKNAEANLKARLGRKPESAPAGKVDLPKFDGRNWEVKTGAGELCRGSEYKPLRGVSAVIYIPVVKEDLPIEEQEGFVLTKQAFIEIIETLGMRKFNKSRCKWNIQTFWNHTKQAPHGKKYDLLLDALYEHCEMTLEEWLEAQGE